MQLGKEHTEETKEPENKKQKQINDKKEPTKQTQEHTYSLPPTFSHRLLTSHKKEKDEDEDDEEAAS